MDEIRTNDPKLRKEQVIQQLEPEILQRSRSLDIDSSIKENQMTNIMLA